jgi:cytochrome c oxidase subunit 2
LLSIFKSCVKGFDFDQALRFIGEWITYKIRLKLMTLFRRILPLIAAFAPLSAVAEENVKPWQMHFQEAVTPVMERVTALHDWLTVMCVVISAFVLALLIYVVFRFNAKSNPVPSKTTHNTMIEIVWTVVPILILLAICIPSFKLHYYMAEQPKADMTLKVVGYQWYWHYQYPDHGNFEYDSYMVEEKDLKKGQLRLLEVDNPVVVPVDTTVLVQMTGGDVIHSWAMPAFGVKKDAMPGRLNETWFRAEKIGTYYGQCSELCGVKHGFMPIKVNVVSKKDFKKWVKESKQKFASNSGFPAQVALNNY